MGERKRRRKNRTPKPPFWLQAVFWGLLVGGFFGLFVAFAVSPHDPQAATTFGVVSFLIGFITGFVLKAVEKLPHRWGEYRSSTRYRGGAPYFDLALFLGLRKRK
jgi:hypothetical protein